MCPYDEKYPLDLDGESLADWMERMEDENPDMSSDIPF